MGSHQSSNPKHQDWYTPRWLIDRLGSFDLDVCTSNYRPWSTAIHNFCVEDIDGLDQIWYGRVWCNPPYNNWAPWIEKLADYGNGLGLIFARTDTRDFHRVVFGRAKSLFFLEGRLRFHLMDGSPGRGNGGAPSVLIAFDDTNTEVLRNAGLSGKLVVLR